LPFYAVAFGIASFNKPIMVKLHLHTPAGTYVGFQNS